MTSVITSSISRIFWRGAFSGRGTALIRLSGTAVVAISGSAILSPLRGCSGRSPRGGSQGSCRRRRLYPHPARLHLPGKVVLGGRHGAAAGDLGVDHHVLPFDLVDRHRPRLPAQRHRNERGNRRRLAEDAVQGLGDQDLARPGLGAEAGGGAGPAPPPPSLPPPPPPPPSPRPPPPAAAAGPPPPPP